MQARINPLGDSAAIMSFWDTALYLESAIKEELEYEEGSDLILFDEDEGFKPMKGGQEEFFSVYPLAPEPPDPFPDYRWTLLLGGIGCLAGETEINGTPIRDLTNSPIKVDSLIGEQWATPAYIKGVADLYRVTTLSGREVIATLEHRLLSPSGWQPLKRLRLGSLVAAQDEEVKGSLPSPFAVFIKEWGDAAIEAPGFGWDTITSIEYVRNDVFYDLHVPIGNHYVANGLVHHNSGKSKCGAVWTILQSLWYPENRGIITAVNFPQLSNATLVTLVETCREYGVALDPWRPGIEENALAIVNRGYCYIGEDRAFWRVQSMLNFAGKTQAGRGQEVQHIWLDEGAYVLGGITAFSVIDGRLRLKGQFCKGLITTSPNGFNWLYDKFADPSRDENLKKIYRLIKCKTADNSSLQSEYLDSLRSSYTEELARQELEAEWISTQVGLVAKYFKRDVHALSEEEGAILHYDPTIPLRLCFDFNYSPAVCVMAQIRGGEAHIFNELYLLDSDLWELMDRVEDWIAANKPQDENVYIYGDASGRQRSVHSRQSAWDIVFERLRKTGLKLHRKFPDANPPIKNRINSLNCLLKQERVYFLKDYCPEVIKDLEMTTWGGEGIDKSDALRTHLLDAFTYFIDTEFPYKNIARPSMGQRKIPGVA